MWFRKKKANRRREEVEQGDKSYSDVLNDRLSSIGGYIHDYDESERAEVEARIRRMFYGAKVEGGIAQRAERPDESDDGFADRAASG